MVSIVFGESGKTGVQPFWDRLVVVVEVGECKYNRQESETL